jgi:hypothetical protein
MFCVIKFLFFVYIMILFHATKVRLFFELTKHFLQIVHKFVDKFLNLFNNQCFLIYNLDIV